MDRKVLAWSGLASFGLLLLVARRDGPTPVPDRQLTPHFWESEFKRSADIPALASYVLTPYELANLRRLAKLLEGLRTVIGTPIRITNGGRPPLVNEYGETFHDILKRKNYRPARHSQHNDFAGADIVTHRDKMLDAFRWLAKQSESNQTILYLKTPAPSSARGAEVKTVPVHIHTSVRQPDKGGRYDKPMALIDIDGVMQKYAA